LILRSFNHDSGCANGATASTIVQKRLQNLRFSVLFYNRKAPTLEVDAMRQHVPSNEITAEGYAPVYHDTKRRMEDMFGERKASHWPANEQTCSKCYSVTPALTKKL
jgi:hypothetical protein